MTDLIKKFDDTIVTIRNTKAQIDFMVSRFFKELKQDLDDLIARFGKSKLDNVATKKTFSKKQNATNINHSIPQGVVKGKAKTGLPVDDISKSGWRADFAVKDEWNSNGNGNGKYVTHTVTEQRGLNVWVGETAGQNLIGTGTHLPGGKDQIWLPPNSIKTSSTELTNWND